MFSFLGNTFHFSTLLSRPPPNFLAGLATAKLLHWIQCHCPQGNLQNRPCAAGQRRWPRQKTGIVPKSATEVLWYSTTTVLQVQTKTA